ncbi:MAG: WD40 repeat domain-containing protein [Cytophagaceae bacterium]|nr:WD40 repeat domain-containing protein [Cytophagaceae bacterium]
MKLSVQKVDTFSGHRDAVYALVPGGESQQIYSAGGDGQVIGWDLRKPDLGTLVAQVPASVYALAFDTARGQLWLGQNFEGIHVIAPAERREIRSLKITSAAIFDLLIHENNAFAALGDGTVVVLDVAGFAVRRHIKASERSARCLALNPLTRELAVGYSDFTVKIFDLDDFTLKTVIEAHSNSVFTLAYSPDGQRLLSGSRDAHFKAWDVAQGYALLADVVAHLFAINHLTFSPDARLFATASMDKSVKIWRSADLKLLKVVDRARHAGHGTSVNKLLWTAHHDQLISASDDRTLSVWAVSED